MSFVHTAFGRGQIIGEETVRGRKQYLVAGSGFQMWIDEADAQIHTGAADFDFEPAEDVNEDNSTDLPYDPTPQFPVEMFADEQTIQPNHELDADDRLSPADSLTFDSVDDREYPGPGEHLFARRTAGVDDEPSVVMIRNDPHGESLGDFVEQPSPEDYGISEEEEPPVCECGHHYLTPGFTHEDWEDWAHRADQEYFVDDPEEGFDKLIEGHRFAGLSDKYIQIEADIDHYNDPVARFRDDPIREINRLGYLFSDDHDDERMNHYAALVDSDSHIREAAWSDVRQKAQRIRREGKMDVHDIDDNKIYATVHGDHGDYDVMIVKGGLGGNSITQWTCSCDWGRHAFKRKVLHVGRLCSHGLAGWLEMQSHELGEAAKKHPYKKRADVVDDYKSYNDENNDGHVDKATVDNFISQPHEDGGIEPMTPEDVTKLYNYVEDNKTQPGRRNYEVPYTFDPDKVYKAADVLRTQPHSLTPDLRFVPEGEDSHFEDVEEDERETTGPDQIVHFSRRRHAIELRPAGESPSDYRRYLEDEWARDRELNWKRSNPLTPEEARMVDSVSYQFKPWLQGAPKDFADWKAAHERGEYIPSWERDARRHYAGEELDPEPYRDFDGGGELLDELREESSTPLEDDFGSMRDRNDDVREIVEELREKGYDADQFVASRRTAADVGHFMRWREKSPAQAYGTHDAADMYAEEHGLDDYELQDLHDWIDTTHGERRASYGVGNQGAGPGGAFGQPGGGNWADQPFAGSGPDPKFWYESSEDYVDAHERPRYEDVTDLGDDDIIKYTKDKPQQKKAWLDSPSPPSEYDTPEDCVVCGKRLDLENTSGVCSKRCQRELDEDNRRFDEGMAQQYEQELADEEELRHLGSVDPIEKFYKSGAAEAIKSGSRSSGGSFSDDAIAERANQFLMRTAGRNYSLAEQRELEDEEHHLGARNLDGLDLSGTHYIS